MRRFALLLFLVLALPVSASELRPLAVLAMQELPPDAGYAELGLSGVNKPNGLPYRFRSSVTPGLPPAIPASFMGCDMLIADRASDGFLVLYKGPYKEASANCEYHAVLYDSGGEELWRLHLNDYLSRPDQLEIQDIHLAGGALYFNEACVSYAWQADSMCSALVSLAPETGRVLWRSADLVSNDIFLVHGDRIICGYGFTSEDDYLHVLDASSGRLLSRTWLDSAHDYLEVRDGRLHVVTNQKVYVFSLE